MASLPISKVILFDKNYCKFAINVFRDYTYANFENLIFWEAIYIKFKY